MPRVKEKKIPPGLCKGKNMQSLYTCNTCTSPAVVLVHKAYTCYECWSEVEASLPPVLILDKPMKETEQ